MPLFGLNPEFRCSWRVVVNLLSFLTPGSLVYYEIPGQISLPKLRENGLDMDSLCRHYVYITEFLWNVSGPRVQRSSCDMLFYEIAVVWMKCHGVDIYKTFRQEGQVSVFLCVVCSVVNLVPRRLSLQ